jgi:phosphoglycolate phosphatase
MPAARTAIVFDLDGTLVDTAPDLTGALNAVLVAWNRPAVDPASVRTMVGNGVRALIARGFAATGNGLTPAEVEARVPDFLAYYGRHLADGSRPYPGVVEGLERFRRLGFKLGVCTNKPHGLASELLDRLALTPFFDAILGGDSRAYRKPDPRHLIDTIDAMGAKSHQAVMIGDSPADVNVARAAGIAVVIAGYGYGTAEADALGADARIARFGDLGQALLRLP